MIKRLNLRQGCFPLLLCVCVAGLVDASAATHGPDGKVLWRIGKVDNDTAEFALGRGGSSRYSTGFPAGALFVVGHSDVGKDFPYIQPGPADAWAGHKSHTFTIIFAVKAPPKTGDCELLFDFVDTHSTKPPKMEIKINERTFIRTTPKGAGDASSAGDVSKGREHIMCVPFGVDVLKAGNNKVTITSLQGSWLLYDYVQLTAPAAVQAAPLDKVTRIADIYSVSQMFRDFEDRYADETPTVRGDFTPYWEDGAGSSARETALNRAAAERLVQAQTLYAMLAPGKYPARKFHEAYRQAILYDEHTWGSWNSISDPEGDFTKSQWKIKQAFALNADKMSAQLLSQSLATIAGDAETVSTVAVFNTCSWPRTDLVILPKEMPLVGDLVKTYGRPVPSQRLSTGQLAFLVRDVPPFASAQFTFHKADATATGSAAAKDNTLANGLLTATVDKTTGAVVSLKHTQIDTDFVDGKGGLGLGDYFYVAGRDPKYPKRNDPVKITVKEKGPLVASLLVASDAPGCDRLLREIRVVDGLDRLDIINIIDKKNIYSQEAVHLAFPFNVPDGVMRMETPWAVVRPEIDQMAGACKNYFTVQHFVDVSNNKFGITWATVDAPLVEVGAITNDPRSPVGWIKKLAPSTTLYSYVMNNYWETNYKASQSGRHTFRYSLRPHRQYDAAAAARFGIEQSRPLIVVPVDPATPIQESLLTVEPAGVIATALKPSDDGRDLILRLFNVSEQKQNAKIGLINRGLEAIFLSNLNEQQLSPAKRSVEMVPWQIVTLRISVRRED